MARITIRDIAKKAGVSPTAVSFVLNNRPGISEETRERVRAIIEEEGFTPSKASRRLVLNKSYNIAFLFDEVASPFNDMFYWGLARAVVDYCNGNEYNLILADVKSEDHVPDVIRTHDVDGVLCFQRASRAVREALVAHGIPYVILDSHTEQQRTREVSVYVDYRRVMHDAFGFLYDQGLKMIALIVSRIVPAYYQEIYRGYREALFSHGLPYREGFVQDNAKDAETGYECMAALLSGDARPDGVICAGDIFAYGAMMCARDRGLRIPQDISFLGIDDLPFSQYSDPPLTAVHVDQEEMGIKGIVELLSMIRGQKGQSRQMSESRLILRRSVRMAKTR